MKFNKLALILLILTTTLGTSSCHKWQVRHKQKRDLREREKQEKQRQKEAEEQYQEVIKQHSKHQSKRSRKEMKRNYKKADRYNNHKKEFFLKRWFKGGKRKTRRSNETI
ncbi:MAG: hypothetical protein DRI84_08460 [Bacteroidetes bacterium]|nr:MAG: hypothetical protein DRI84_08460 [Bacteroidota bacterium]